MEFELGLGLQHAMHGRMWELIELKDVSIPGCLVKFIGASDV